MNEVIRITSTQTLVVHECYKCHIPFALPEDLINRAKENQNVSFYCPNGHGAVYSETETLRLRHKLDQTEGELAYTNRRLNGALKEITNKKREITRIKNRAKAGVCLECHRTIKQMSDHTKSCHLGKEEALKVAKEHKEA